MGEDGTFQIRRGRQVERVAFRAAVKFNYVLFPLDLPTFAKALVTRGFSMAGELPIEPLGLPPGASVGGQGIVGTKGDLKADINTDKQFFGVAGRVDAKLVLTELREVFKVLEGIVEGGNVAFFELQARYRVKSKEDLLSAVRRAGRQAEIVKEAAKSFGQPIDLFSAQLTGGGTGPNSTAYFEVWIQPIPAIPDAGLGIGVVMRSPSQEEFALSANRFEIDLSKFLNALLDTKP